MNSKFRLLIQVLCLLLIATVCVAEPEASNVGTAAPDAATISAPSPVGTAADKTVACNAIGDRQTDEVGTRAMCTADCGNFPDVSCAVRKGSCTAVDRDCANGQRGFVTCSSSGSSTTFCPACACTDGQVRYTSSSECCCNYDNPDSPERLRKRIREVCSNGQWVYNGVSCDGSPCGGPSCPL